MFYHIGHMCIIYAFTASILCCQAGSPTKITGKIHSSDGDVVADIVMSRAFFGYSDEPEIRTVVEGTNIDTTCEDISDGITDMGGYPKTVLVISLYNQGLGIYTGAENVDGNEKYFGGGVAIIDSETSYSIFDITSGTLEIIFEGEYLDANIEAELGGWQNEIGSISGTIHAEYCNQVFSL